MKKVKLNFAGINVPLKIQKAKTIVLKMTGNTNFATPNPSLSNVSQAITRLEVSYENALDGGKSKKAAMRIDEAALDILMVQVAAYVQDISGGDENKILSSGLEVRNSPSAPQYLNAPMEARILLKNNNGEANLKWKSIKNAKAYIIQSTLTPNIETSWNFTDFSTKSSYKALGLASQTILWFRIAAIGAKGKGIWSDPVKATIS